MKTVVLTLGTILLLTASFLGGYYTSNRGLRVVDQDGSTLLKSNAAQLVKDENQRMGQAVIGKTEAQAEELLKAGNRTFAVGKRDGKDVLHTGQKTFTNLTVEVKDGKVIKVMGWY